MATSRTTKPFFNNFRHLASHKLLDELTAEVIQIHGMDMYYLPRRRSAEFDPIYYEDTQSTFDTALQIPILFKTAEGFMGSEAMLSHFGIESRLQMILTISRAQWEVNILPNEPNLGRPREGDLIHVTDFDRRTYEIKFVDPHPYFYQHGHTPMWDLHVELWEYGGEDLDTGIEEVDCMARTTSTNAYDWALKFETNVGNGDAVILTEDDDIITREQFRTAQELLGVIDSNDELQADTHPLDANTSIINWDENNPYDEGEPWG